MQVTPIVLKEFNKLNPGKRYSLKDMKNPEKSVEVGEWYLRERIEKHYFEKENIAPTNKNLAGAYNAGPNRLRDYLKRGVPLPRETTIYMDKIN